MSFPVVGTFMIEPTESESLAAIDEFCDAMIAIRAEVDRVASGEWDAADNPLKNAPHTAEMLTAQEWNHPYLRTDGCYPGAGPGTAARAKYWPPVRRIDQAYGDRNLVCACPSPAAFEQSGVRVSHAVHRAAAPAATPAGAAARSRLVRREGGEKPLGCRRRRRSRR